MGRIGSKHTVWNKELDDKLLEAIKKRKNHMQLSILLNTSRYAINKRLREMGFDDLADARKVLNN